MPELGTHGLRHSTANIYRHFGATKDDMVTWFDHSSRELTDRYDHYQDTNLDRVARRIRLVTKSTMHAG